jgi:hypothetical protein
MLKNRLKGMEKVGEMRGMKTGDEMRGGRADDMIGRHVSPYDNCKK